VWHGDRTPIETGHLTLDPAAHISVYSVICLLLAGIAWGSMPVDPRRMRGAYAPAAVSAAGPLANVLLGAAGLVSLGLWLRYAPGQVGPKMQTLRYLLLVFGATNVHLAIFNLLPVPPLDGSGILANLSRPYGRLLANLQASGASFLLLMILFTAVGNLTEPLALKVATWMVVTARGG
jgi:Zn-dependent protease